MTGAKIDLVYERGYPVTVNHGVQTEIATEVAKQIAGDVNVHPNGAEDGCGGFLLHAGGPPGAFIFCGNGDSAGLHHPAYYFNDEAIVYGTSYWIKLVREHAGGVRERRGLLLRDAREARSSG